MSWPQACSRAEPSLASEPPLSTGGDLGVRELPATVCASLQFRGPRETLALGCWWLCPVEALKLGCVRVTMQPRPWAWPEGEGWGVPGTDRRCCVVPSAWPLWSETVPGKTWVFQQSTWPAACLAAPRASGCDCLEPGMGRRQAGEVPGPGRGGGREKGAALRALGVGVGPPHAVCSRGRHAVPRVPLTPPRAVGSSDWRSSDCAAVLLMLQIHGNHVCGAVSAPQVLQEGASQLPHWPTGALSEWKTSLPHLDLNPDRQAASEPGLSAQGPPHPGQAKLGGWADVPRVAGVLAGGQEGHCLGRRGVSGPSTEARARGGLAGLLGGRGCFSPPWFGGRGVRGMQQWPLHPRGRDRALVQQWPAGVWVGGRQSLATPD